MTGPGLLPALERWELAGGVWRVLARSSTHVSVALCRCDGGEEVERLVSDEPEAVRALAGRESSED